MTIRERIERTLRRQPVDGVPFTCYEGLLPPGAEVPGLGRVRTCQPYAITQPNVRWTNEALDDGTELATIETPVGTLTQRARREPGYGSRWTVEHFVKEPRDYEVLEFCISDAQLEARPEAWVQAQEDLGDRGVVLASLPRAPLQRLWIEFAGIERLSLDLHDCREQVRRVVAAMAAQAGAIAALLAEGPAEFIWLPDNVTGEMVGPPLFEELMAPYYAAVAATLHPKSKGLVCHMDGMMRRLKECVAATELDVIEAFTPPPDADLPLDEARAAWEGKAVWINFPSSVHLADPERIRQVTHELVRQGTHAPGFAISVTENIPAQVGTRSLEAIAAALQ